MRSPESPWSTTMAGYSRLPSSTMFRVRKVRPFASVSPMKSIDQPDVRLGRWHQDDPAASRKLLPPLAPRGQALLAVEPVDALVVSDPALPPEECVQPTVAEPWSAGYQRPQRLPAGIVVA